MSPTPEDLAGMSEAVEHFFVEAFIPQLPIEAFDEAILLRFAGRDIVPGDAGFILPFEDGATGQFAAIVRDDGFRPAIEPDAPIEFPHDACTGDRRVGNQRQAFPCVIVDYAEHAEPAGRSEHV